jgi:uncharacterized protein (DUF58 family)
VVLDRSRVYVFPTGHGLVFAAALLAMFVGAINYGNSLGLALSFWLGALGFVTILHTYLNLAGLAVEAGRAAPVFSGESACFPLHLQLSGSKPRHAVGVLLPGESRSPLLDVPPAGGTTALLHRAAPRRGRLRLGRFTVESRFPLGLLRAWAYLEFEAECVVYPRPAPPSPLPTQGAEPPWDVGSRGRGEDDFAGLRPYAAGDPPRSVHWRASARTGELLVKQWGGGQAVVWLDWADAGDTDPEARLSRLCRWCLDAHRAGHAWGLGLPGSSIPPDRGDAHLHRCLAALADWET